MSLSGDNGTEGGLCSKNSPRNLKSSLSICHAKKGDKNMKVTKQIEVYLLRKRNIRPIDVVQSDTGVELVFSVKDFVIPDGTTATLYVQKPSGKFVYQEKNITVVADTITVDLENQAITEYGRVGYQVTLKNGSDTVTTFAGLMNVEKSLKDSGVESKTVVNAFDDLTAAQVATFRERAELIAAEVIATIPEDYTALDTKVDTLVDSVANAVKGNLSGAVVRADDVSPVAHNPVVRVYGKNLINYPAFTEVLIFNGVATFSDDGILTLTATKDDCYTLHSPFPIEARIPVKPGEVFTLSWDSDATEDNRGEVYILPDGKPVDFGRTLATAKKLTYTVPAGYEFIVYRFGVEKSGATIKYWNLQIERGETVTEYKPYIDPATVEVLAYGKNLIGLTDREIVDFGGGDASSIRNFTGKSIIVGFASNNFYFPANVSNVNIREGYLSFESSQGGYGVALDMRVRPNTTYSISHVKLTNVSAVGITEYTENGEYIGFASLADTAFTTGPNTKWVVVCFRHIDNNTKTEIDKIQVETGEAVTEYEPFNGANTYIPNVDGTVSGLVSVSPSMTILTDTDGVTVDCEYNRDTNKVIDRLVKAIEALGGTV